VRIATYQATQAIPLLAFVLPRSIATERMAETGAKVLSVYSLEGARHMTSRRGCLNACPRNGFARAYSFLRFKNRSAEMLSRLFCRVPKSKMW
jgi:hypothetical protein